MSMDFPDPIDGPGRKPRPGVSPDFPDPLQPSITNPTPRPRSDVGRIVEAIEQGNAYLYRMERDVAQQTTMLRFMSGFVMICGIVLLDVFLGGLLFACYLIVQEAGGLTLAMPGLIIGIAIFAIVTILHVWLGILARRAAFRIFKIRA